MDLRFSRSLAVLLIAVLGVSGCSISRFAVNKLGDALAGGGSTYATDDDPELVGQALPFALKTIESLLQSSPKHRGLLLAAASGFTQYGYAYVQCEADYVEGADLARATELRRRAVRLYRRALAYGLRALEAEHPGFAAALRRDAAAGAAMVDRDDAAIAYWTGLAWAAAAAVSKEGDLVADLPLAEALMRRVLAVDEGLGGGAVHDFFIAFEGGRPASAGGSEERARRHLERALELAHGERVAPLVSFAETVCVARQDRGEFSRLLALALALDADRFPRQRLANLVAQRRARWLLARADELFVE
jgi:predicted anti-sigma-YlaC factor YlaD